MSYFRPRGELSVRSYRCSTAVIDTYIWYKYWYLIRVCTRHEVLVNTNTNSYYAAAAAAVVDEAGGVSRNVRPARAIILLLWIRTLAAVRTVATAQRQWLLLKRFRLWRQAGRLRTPIIPWHSWAAGFIWTRHKMRGMGITTTAA